MSDKKFWIRVTGYEHAQKAYQEAVERMQKRYEEILKKQSEEMLNPTDPTRSVAALKSLPHLTPSKAWRN